MNAEELMIDDLVRTGSVIAPIGRYSGVFSCYTPLKGEPYKRLRIMVSDTDGADVPESQIFPIPLTEKMLEINGFKWSGTWRAWCFFGEGKRHIMVAYDGDMFYIHSTRIRFKYVHELQRLLRCCGFWEKARLFKVENNA